MYVAKKLKNYHKGCVSYRKTQAYLKCFQLQSKKSEDECSGQQSSDMQTLKQADCKKFGIMKNQVQSYSRPKRDIMPQLNLIYEALSE